MSEKINSQTQIDVRGIDFGGDESDGESVECWNCGGEGYRDLYEEDPMWYDEDEVEKCEICEGKGFYIVPFGGGDE